MKTLLFAVLIFLFVLNPNSSFAQDSSATSSGKSKKVEYTLPYPGILPDSPLYPFKALRDRIVSFLMSDPAKKAEFNLLSADKRLNAGVYLFAKGESKQKLAHSTISKGANYFEQGISQLELLKKQNYPLDSLIQKYQLASYKHQEVLRELIRKSKGDIQKGLSATEERIENFQNRLNKLRSP